MNWAEINIKLTYEQEVDIIIDELLEINWQWIEITNDNYIYHMVSLNEPGYSSVCGQMFFESSYVIYHQYPVLNLPINQICIPCFNYVTSNPNKFRFEKIEINTFTNEIECHYEKQT